MSKKAIRMCAFCHQELRSSDGEDFCAECEDRYPFHILQASLDRLPGEKRPVFCVTLRSGGQFDFDGAVPGCVRGPSKRRGTILSQWIMLYKNNKLIGCVSEDCIESTNED